VDTISAKSMYLRTPKARFLVLISALLFWVCSMPAMQITNAATINQVSTSISSMLGNIGKAVGTSSGGISTLNGGGSIRPTPPPVSGSLSIVKLTNNSDGPILLVGTPVAWSYLVTNTGNIKISNIIVKDSDPAIGQVNNSPFSLDAGKTKLLWEFGSAVKGDYANTATATGSYQICNDLELNTISKPTPAPVEVTATDTSSYFGADPQIALDKLTNGTDGALVPVGNDVVWTYKVTNLGNIELTNIVVTDDVLGNIGTIASLAPGAYQTLTAPTGTAELGYHGNVGTAVGTYSLTPVVMTETTLKPTKPLTVTAIDHSSYTGVNVGISIDKTTNGIDGPVLLAGDAITWSYLVKNTGDYTLFDINVEDSEEGTVGIIDTLAPGASETLTLSGTAFSGDYSNIGTATGHYNLQIVAAALAIAAPTDNPVQYPTVTASDESYYECYGPAITIDKTTNGSDGLSITIGSAITWSYLVTNTGDMELTDIVVTDSKEGPVGTIPYLDVGESETLTLTGTAAAGLYENTGTATGTYTIEDIHPTSISIIEPTGTPEQTTVSDSDNSSYTGTQPYYPPSYS